MRVRRIVVAATALTVSLTGCSGGDSSSDGGAAASPSSQSPSLSLSLSASLTPSPAASAPAAGTSSSAGATAGSAAPLVVHIRKFAYVPANPTVAVGQRVIIINDDAAAHTWTAAPKSNWRYDSGNLEKGQRATFPGFRAAGRYPYLCLYHAEMPTMTGTITVR